VVIDSAREVDTLDVPNPDKIAYLTQTTLSVDDTRDVIEALRRKFPRIVGPSRDDICYATQNRQAAVKRLAGDVDVLLVIGAANSSNANRLVEVSRMAGTRAYLINDVNDIKADWLAGAGIKGGVAHAQSDEWSGKAKFGRTYCYDLHAAVLHLLGIGHEKLTLRHNATNRLPTDVHGEVSSEIVA
jgi:4-hydroxy-3-methylbut-2-enyl diphosphate reductase